MSSRSGVRCYPAIKENSEKKYIVKAISIPASSVQLDALLLTGAYKDPADAMDYFREQADRITEEAQTLQKLSRLEGFLPYEAWQVEPMENGRLGYRIFLVSSYKRTLDKYMRRSLITHQQAVNLGLDLCAALAICRRAGYLYVDLKPSNIFLSEEKEYRIGDLGFAKLDALKFTSLPEKYVSPYSAPEVQDALNPLNETVDTYALGMLLYQIYNDGQLPVRGKDPAEALPSPCNADYEIAEIIMKAIAFKPEDRWSDPLEMGKALAAYLQRNSVSNDPISTASVPVLEPDFTPVTAVRQETAPEQAPAQPEAREEAQESAAEAAPVPEEAEAPPVPEDAEADSAEETPAPAEAAAPRLPTEEELRQQELEEARKLFDFDLEGIDLRSYDEISQEEAAAEPPEETPAPETAPAPRSRKWISLLILLVILAGAIAGGLWFYRNHYLQTIDQMTVEGDMDRLVVTLDTDTPDALLSVSCTDTYGNTVSSDVTGGQAVFTELKPGTQYRLEVLVDGFHGLTGYTSQYFTTSDITQVVSFTAVTGAEDGSVMLTFTVDGADTEDWIVTYGTPDEDYRMTTFSGHSVTIRELTVGKTYTFTLEGVEKLNLSGTTEISFTASRLVLANDLRVVSCHEGNLKVQWAAPEDVTVSGWTVRLFSEDGDQTMLTTDQTEILIPGVDTTQAYTIEVVADGMLQGVRTSITANPITVQNITVNEEDPESLTVSWEYSGQISDSGWLLMYSIDGSDYQSVVKCDGPSGIITPRIHGATYEFEIRSADGISLFENILVYSSPNAEIFDSYALPAESIEANLLATPQIENWSYKNVSPNDYTSTFALGTPISLMLHATKDFTVPRDEVNLLYVIRDGHSRVIPELISQETITWWDLWINTDHHYCELDLPKIPDTPGNYTLALYFNGLAVMAIEFTIQ